MKCIHVLFVSQQSQQVGGSLNVNLHLLLLMCLFVLCVTKTTTETLSMEE